MKTLNDVPSCAQGLTSFTGLREAVAALRPHNPVYCLREASLRRAARRMIDWFPGRVLYAVKCNPHPIILRALHGAGIRHFDTASLPEIALIDELFGEEATSYFMHPVKTRPAIRMSKHLYNIRAFSVDHLDELVKIKEEIPEHHDLTLFARIATPPSGASFDLSRKFGAGYEEAIELLRAIERIGCRPALSFHVGSQCLIPGAWRVGVELAASIARASGVAIATLDVGGGFPVEYEGELIPPLSEYLAEIRSGLRVFGSTPPSLLCEPGRMLVANAVSLITRVILRKGDRLYINDGVYGSFSEAVSGEVCFPARLIRIPGEAKQTQRAFILNGPSCDNTDILPTPVLLPEDTREGDWICFERAGAYSWALASHFNGFHPETWIQIRA